MDSSYSRDGYILPSFRARIFESNPAFPRRLCYGFSRGYFLVVVLSGDFIDVKRPFRLPLTFLPLAGSSRFPPFEVSLVKFNWASSFVSIYFLDSINVSAFWDYWTGSTGPIRISVRLAPIPGILWCWASCHLEKLFRNRIYASTSLESSNDIRQFTFIFFFNRLNSFL